MDKKHTSLKFKAKIKPLEKINDEFTLCKCYVQGVGKNRNYSYMSKENIQRCLPTLSYAPVVGHLIDKLDDDGNPTGEKYMGGHDYYIDENWNLKSACVPYGVVKADSFDFEIVEEYEDKVKTEYLTAEIILWTGRYPELMDAIYAEDFYFNQSMEVSVDDYRPYEKDSNYTELVDFTYSALCLLGKADDKDSIEHTEPCFIESKVIPVQYSIKRDEFSKVMGELKTELAFYFNKDSEGKEETFVEDTKNEVTETVEEVIEETTDEVVEETSEETPETDNVDTVNDNVDEAETETTELEDETVETEEVEDEIVEETENETEENEYELLKSEYEEYKNTHSHTNEEYEELKKYRDDAEFKKTHAERENILADDKYSVLSENEAFAELKKNMDNYSLADLEKEAKVIFADHVASIGTFSIKEDNKKTTSVKTFTNVSSTKKTNSRYGNLKFN